MEYKKKKKPMMVIIGVICILAITFIVFSMDLVPPKERQTEIRMFHLTNEIINYRNTNKRWPDVLGDLKVDEWELSDAWKRVLIYSFINDSMIELKSLGRDGIRSKDDIVMKLKVLPTGDINREYENVKYMKLGK